MSRPTSRPTTWRRARRGGAALVLAVAALATTAGSLRPAPAQAAPASEADQVVDQLNAFRGEKALPPLREVTELDLRAQAQARTMAAAGRLSHNPQLTSQVTGWSALGENTGYGTSPQHIHTLLVASVPHRANMLDPRFKEVGIGAVRAANGTLWVAQVFRAPAPGVAPAPSLPAFPQLGPTVGPEYDAGGGARAQAYALGAVWGSRATGTHAVTGSILSTYRALGAERSGLGLPVAPELPAPDGRGRFSAFERGSIYWSPTTRASAVLGAVRDRWAALGWELGPLGYPVSDELPTPDGRGRYNHFTGGSVYWTPAGGAHEVRGSIRELWARTGWEAGVLGFPATGELPTPDGRGRFTHFAGGSIYWTPTTAAHEVHGLIRQRWAETGWELGRLGYPVSDEYAVPGGRRTDFERGSLTWSAATGAVQG